MKTARDVRPVTYLKTHASQLLRQVGETHSPVIITQNGAAKAILLDTESFDEMQEAFVLMKLIAQSEDDIQHGRVKSQEAVFSGVEKRLKQAAK
jgi:prevent-host-death family protein